MRNGGGNRKGRKEGGREDAVGCFHQDSEHELGQQTGLAGDWDGSEGEGVRDPWDQPRVL